MDTSWEGKGTRTSMLVRGNRRARETGFQDRKTDCQTDLREAGGLN